jgi:hypothetical protein
VREGDDLTTFMCRMSWKSGSPNLLEPSGPHRTCYGIPPPDVVIALSLETQVFCPLGLPDHEGEATVVFRISGGTFQNWAFYQYTLRCLHITTGCADHTFCVVIQKLLSDLTTLTVPIRTEVIWIMISCSHLSEQRRAPDPEDGCSMFHRRECSHLPDYTVPTPRRR